MWPCALRDRYHPPVDVPIEVRCGPVVETVVFVQGSLSASTQDVVRAREVIVGDCSEVNDVVVLLVSAALSGSLAEWVTDVEVRTGED